MLIGKFHGLEKLFEKQVLTHENNETVSIYDKELIKIDFTGCHSILKDFNQKEDQVSRSKKAKVIYLTVPNLMLERKQNWLHSMQ